jgi:hypothetical protein
MGLEKAIEKYVVECRNGRLVCGNVIKATSRRQTMVSFSIGRDHNFWPVVASIPFDSSKPAGSEASDDDLYDEAARQIECRLSDLQW